MINEGISLKYCHQRNESEEYICIPNYFSLVLNKINILRYFYLKLQSNKHEIKVCAT